MKATIDEMKDLLLATAKQMTPAEKAEVRKALRKAYGLKDLEKEEKEGA